MIIKLNNKELGREVFIPDWLLSRMENLGRSFHPKEFGGIISGIVIKEGIFVFDLKLPENFRQSDTLFEREATDLNEYLATLHKMSEGAISYLGEWHTHPDGDPSYSKQDEKTMISIAKDTDVKINNPLLIILGISKRTTNIAFYIVNQNKLFPLTKSK